MQFTEHESSRRVKKPIWKALLFFWMISIQIFQTSCSLVLYKQHLSFKDFSWSGHDKDKECYRSIIIHFVATCRLLHKFLGSINDALYNTTNSWMQHKVLKTLVFQAKPLPLGTLYSSLKLPQNNCLHSHAPYFTLLSVKLFTKWLSSVRTNWTSKTLCPIPSAPVLKPECNQYVEFGQMYY